MWDETEGHWPILNHNQNVSDRAQVGRQFRGLPLEARIRQVYGDSAHIDWRELGAPFDLIFVNGCHDFPYVRSDTENARRHAKVGGEIVWHDYGMIGHVCRAVDEFAVAASGFRVQAIEGTRLALAFRSEKSDRS